LGSAPTQYIHSGHRKFDLDLKWNQRKFNKIKIGKPVHGVMICDVLLRKNTKYGIPRFQRKLFTKMAPRRSSLDFSTQSLVCASFITNFQIFTPFFAEMGIFLYPTTFVTRFF
jgi:hypothetical protein